MCVCACIKYSTVKYVHNETLFTDRSPPRVPRLTETLPGPHPKLWQTLLIKPHILLLWGQMEPQCLLRAPGSPSQLAGLGSGFYRRCWRGCIVQMGCWRSPGCTSGLVFPWDMSGQGCPQGGSSCDPCRRSLELRLGWEASLRPRAMLWFAGDPEESEGLQEDSGSLPLGQPSAPALLCVSAYWSVLWVIQSLDSSAVFFVSVIVFFHYNQFFFILIASLWSSHSVLSCFPW